MRLKTSTILRTALILILGYVGILGFLLLNSSSTIYPFFNDQDARQPAGLPGVTLASIQTAELETVAWVVPPQPDQPVVLIFVGNAGQMGHGVLKAGPLVEAGYGVAILSYPGANGAPGRPSEQTITAASRDLLTHVEQEFPDAPAPVLYGISLGAAVAAQLAAAYPVSAVMLEAPFTSTYDLARDIYPFLPPINLLPDNRWETLEAARRISAPALVMHGRQDSIVPHEHGVRIAQELPGDPDLRLFEGGGHNDLHLHGAGVAVLEFLADLVFAT